MLQFLDVQQHFSKLDNNNNNEKWLGEENTKKKLTSVSIQAAGHITSITGKRFVLFLLGQKIILIVFIDNQEGEGRMYE